MKTKVIISGLVYSVKEVEATSYGVWQLARIESVNGDNLFEQNVLSFSCSDRVKCYLDELAKNIVYYYSGAVPVDLEVHPIAGFTFTDSLRKLYGSVAPYTGYTDFVEIGRKAGYYGGGVTPLLAKSLVQTNKPEIQPLIDTFNTRMGRL